MYHNRLLIITNVPSPYQVEFFRSIALKCPEFKVLFTRRNSPGRNWDKVDVAGFENYILKEIRIKNHLYINIEFKRLIREIYRTEAIVVCQYSSVTMLIAVVLAFLLRKRIIFWSEPIDGVKYEARKIVHNEKLSLLFRKLALLPFRLLVRRYFYIGRLAKISMQKYGLRGDFTYMPYAFNYNNFKYRGGYERKEDCVRYLFTGSLSYRKGSDMLLETVVKLLVDTDRKIKITIAGSGDYLAEFERINDSRLSVLGYVSPIDIPELYHRHDVFVFPSRYDGWALSITEALAGGLYVISTPFVGAANDLVVPGNGVILESLSSEKILEEMLRYTDFSREEIETNKKRISRSVMHLDKDTMAESFIKNIFK